MYHPIQKIHLIGIGGIGMSGIAEILCQHGYRVSGSDRQNKETLQRLSALGVEVFLGHQASHVPADSELVVYSSAVPQDNPELEEARRRGVPAIRRAEMLAELMRLKYGIAVAGSHGKTTTTSMVSFVLTEAGLDPTIVVGGGMDNFHGKNARLGNGDFMVVEADESDGSFNRLCPSISVVTNLDREHLDYFGTMDQLNRAFFEFIEKTPFYGVSILCGDDPYLQAMLPHLSRRRKTYGFSEGNTYRIEQYAADCEKTSFFVRVGQSRERIELSLSGRHNALNALAALCVADELSISRKVTIDALFRFQGVQRRFQRRGEINGVRLVDDYAHHPREIQATLQAARERFPESSLHVIFQPHRFSRVKYLMDEFSNAFDGVCSLWVLDIYSAGEVAQGVTSELLVEKMQRCPFAVSYVPSAKDAMKKCLAQARSGDVILTMGAGDLPQIYREFL